MSSTQKGALILASIVVILVIYVLNHQHKGSPSEALGASLNLGGRFSDIRQRIKDWNNARKAKAAKKMRGTKKSLGARKARVDPNLDCSNVSPSDPNWGRCAQGSGVGRIPSKNASNAVSNTSLNFVSDSLKNQGLGSRIQDGFVQDQFDSDASTNLGSKGLGGSKINLQNNAFFSQGTENATSSVTSGLSTQGAAAFPFSRKSDGPADTVTDRSGPGPTGPVPGTEAVGMGMSFKEFTKGSKSAPEGGSRPMGKREVVDKEGKGARRGEFVAKPSDEELGNAFNPFVDTPSSTLGAGLKISEAFEPQSLGSGSLLSDAFGTNESGSLGSAVSPVSSEVNVSPEEISAATAVLKNVNIVQSTTGGQLNFGIRP